MSRNLKEKIKNVLINYCKFLDSLFDYVQENIRQIFLYLFMLILKNFSLKFRMMVLSVVVI